MAPASASDLPRGNPRLNAILAEYTRRQNAGQPIDKLALLNAYPDLARELRSWFASETMTDHGGRSEAAETIAPRVLPEAPSPRETPRSGEAIANDTASEFQTALFGRYQILRPIGEGAMGTVFLAHDQTLDRRVALKIPKINGIVTTEFAARFAKEAKSAARLSHPNVCSVFDTGEHDGMPYITMEFIDGVPLSRFIGSSQFRSIDSILNIITSIAEAVQHAHSKGVIHRDLKPGNILVDANLKPWVTDFGLARRINSQDESGFSQEGLLTGTPAYMAPEQVKGEQQRIGPACDIYALGVMLFELLTSRLPFEGSVPEILAQVVRQHPPSPGKFRNDVGEDLDDLCGKMLRKDPDRRFGAMSEVISAIEKLRETLNKLQAKEEGDSRQQTPFDIEKSHIEQMIAKGQYTAAIGDLEKLSRSSLPGAKDAAAWARRMLPKVRAEAKALNPAALAALLQTAEQLFQKYDYPGVIQLLDDVPALRRSEAMEELLAKAQAREAESERLLSDIKDRERRQNLDGIEPLVRRFLKLKPTNLYAKKLWEALQSYSSTPATRRSYRFERGRLKPMSEPGFLRQWAMTGVLVFVLVFLSVYSYTVNYLDGDTQAQAVHADKAPAEKTDVSEPAKDTVVEPSPSTIDEETDATKLKLKVLAAALLEYHKQTGTFPSTKTVGSVDAAETGWRVRVLPYLEFAETFNLINFELPWDSSVNQSHLAFLPEPYSSDGLSPQQRAEFQTTFVAPSGKGTVLGHEHGIRIGDITDGTANTILLISVPPKYAVPWASPNEFPINMDDPLKEISTFPQGRVTVAMCDGTIKEIPASLEAEQWNRLLQYNDGGFVDWQKIGRAAVEPDNRDSSSDSPIITRSDNVEPLRLLLPPSQTVRVNERVHFAIDVSTQSVSGEKLEFSSGPLPPGARFDPKTQEFEWLVGVDQFGNGYECEFRVETKSIPPISDSARIHFQVQPLPMPEKVQNSIQMELARIPVGTMYGDPNSSNSLIENSRTYLIGTTEVTQSQFRRVMEKGPSHFSRTNGGKASVRGLNTSDFPVESVSWLDAAMFCNRLSELEGLTPYYSISGEKVNQRASNGYRLPSLREWRFAAFAGNSSILDLRGNSIHDYAWVQENSSARPHEVATRKPNAFGLYDLYGNVWELTSPPGSFLGSVSFGGPASVSRNNPIRGFNNGVRYRASDVGFRVVRSE